MPQPILIAFSGQPGVGKTTIARSLASELGCVFLRIDSIETALNSVDGFEMQGPEGYLAAAAVARDHLLLGHTVIADAVNEDIRGQQMWIDLAAATGLRLFPVAVICSDTVEHRRRVEERVADLPGHVLPDWTKVTARKVHPWPVSALNIDSAALPPVPAAMQIATAVRRLQNA